MKSVRGWLALFSACALASCASAPLSEVALDATGAWSEDGAAVLVVQVRYRTSNTREPFFNAPSARDWQFVAQEADRTLGNRKELLRWTNASGDGGGLPHQPIFWLRARRRLIFVESQTPILLDLVRGERFTLRPPETVLATLFGEHLVQNAFARSPVPAPDGSIVAVFFTATYLDAGPLSPQRFRHAVCFFDAASGSHLHSTRVPYADDTLDPALTPLPRELPHYWRFLWRSDSRGVFAFERNRAWFVATDGSPPRSVDRVPARPVPTRGGPTFGGVYLKTIEERADPNGMKLELGAVANWIDFDRVEMVPVATIRYAGPGTGR